MATGSVVRRHRSGTDSGSSDMGAPAWASWDTLPSDESPDQGQDVLGEEFHAGAFDTPEPEAETEADEKASSRCSLSADLRE